MLSCCGCSQAGRVQKPAWPACSAHSCSCFECLSCAAAGAALQCFVVSTLVSMTPAAPFLFRSYEFPAHVATHTRQVPGLAPCTPCPRKRAPPCRSVCCAVPGTPHALWAFVPHQHHLPCATLREKRLKRKHGHAARSCAHAPAAAATTCGRRCARHPRRPTTWTTSDADPTGARRPHIPLKTPTRLPAMGCANLQMRLQKPCFAKAGPLPG